MICYLFRCFPLRSFRCGKLIPFRNLKKQDSFQRGLERLRLERENLVNSKKLESLIEGRPDVLIHNGKLFEKELEHAQLTHHELMAALRKGGCTCVEDVRAALLESDGTISVIPKNK